jgi:drug/metabolite transporter (DMT)-like permease
VFWHPKTWGSHLITAILFLIVCLCWGTTWIGIEIAVETSPPLTSAGLRFVIAVPMFVAFALGSKARMIYPASHQLFFWYITLFYFVFPYWLINFGQQFVSSGLTALLFSTMPVFILIFSGIILKQRIFLSQAIGMVIGFSGLVLVITGQGLHLSYSSSIGIIAIMSAAIMHGLCYVMTKKLGKDIDIITFNTLPIGVAGVMLLASGIFLESPEFSTFSLNSILALLYLGIVASVGGFIVYFFLLKRMNPIILSFVFIIFPVFAIMIDSWYDRTPLSENFIIFTLILLAGFAITKFPVELLLRSVNAGKEKGLRSKVI